MLTLLLGVALQSTSPLNTHVPVGLSMRDTTPPGSPAGVPFTRDEYVRAQLQVRSREESESLAQRLFDAPEVIGAHLMDGDLLLLAMLSEALAERVIAFRPSLRPQVERFRQNREQALKSWRAALADPPPL